LPVPAPTRPVAPTLAVACALAAALGLAGASDRAGGLSPVAGAAAAETRAETRAKGGTAAGSRAGAKATSKSTAKSSGRSSSKARAGDGPKHTSRQDAKSEADAKAALAKVRERIQKITEDVQDDVAKRDGVAAELRDADKSVASARARLESVRGTRETSERRRAELRAEQARAEAELATERDALAAQLRSAYVAGREEPLKVLLNAKDPATLGRMMQYYAYFGRARADTIATIDAQVAHLEQLDQELADEGAKLASLEQRRRDEVSALDAARARREKALAALTARIDTRSTELRELKNNAQALEQLVEKLRLAMEEFDASEVTSSAGRRGFEAARGRLPWPARGRVVANWGDARPGGLRWNGVLLETTPGATVRAPYYGRVIYADWLTGLGQLVILDHGGGYISLYANNEQIRAQVGQRVEPGDVLATSGTAGYRPELYFEIRKGSRPTDPRPWLKGSPGG
jgi:septal ring factor EnvC (AmiA/AmiB activator)